MADPKQITLTLNVQTYNTIIQAVQELPWRLANPIFQEIDPQVRAALNKDQKGTEVTAGESVSPVK